MNIGENLLKMTVEKKGQGISAINFMMTASHPYGKSIKKATAILKYIRVGSSKGDKKVLMPVNDTVETPHLEYTTQFSLLMFKVKINSYWNSSREHELG